MAVDNLYNHLNAAKDALEKAIDEFDALSNEANEIGGDLARVLTSQAQVSIDQILAVVQGEGQNSIIGLTDYLDNVPLKSLKAQSGSEKYVKDTGSATGGVAPASQPVGGADIDVTPDTEGGPKSAVQEDIDLSQYYKNFATKKKMNEAIEPSWDSIRSNDLFVNSVDLGDEMSASATNDYIPGIDDGIINTEEYDDGEINDYEGFDDLANGEGSWEDAMRVTDRDGDIFDRIPSMDLGNLDGADSGEGFDGLNVQDDLGEI